MAGPEYHLRQHDSGFQALQEDGSILGMRVGPVDRAGIYARGKASYPSSLIMTAVPAPVAECPVILMTPRRESPTQCWRRRARGDPSLQDRRSPGHRAVAYGTATIPRVDKIVGPGNRWVAEAKRRVAGLVGT